MARQTKYLVTMPYHIDGFDAEETEDPVLITIFTIVNERASTNIGDIVRINFQKILLLTHIRHDNKEINDIADWLSNLNLGGPALYRLQSSPSSGSESQSPQESTTAFYDLDLDGMAKAARDCRTAIAQIRGSDNNASKSACDLMIQIMAEKGYQPPPFVGSYPNLDSICYLFYAVLSDCHYLPHDNPVSSPCASTEFQVEVVTHLRLCGGQPATTDQRTLRVDASLQKLIEEVSDVQVDIDLAGSERVGNVTDLDDDDWYFQHAAHREALLMILQSWKPVCVELLHEIKSHAPSNKCFIMNPCDPEAPYLMQLQHVHAARLKLTSAQKKQLNISASINAKQAYLYANTEFGTWTWALWKSTAVESASPVPFVPSWFVPAFGIDGDKFKKPSKRDLTATQQVKQRKRREEAENKLKEKEAKRKYEQRGMEMRTRALKQ
ncbi:hypothetical protein D6C78_01013 [Aureobasidium pullulans]|uniref:Uncharacterized protein n=1 Tax=Aureobasidium pullulans TaxID=5580 RepID=A0A4T0CBX1_AURPU|nr:hypothetical protein D6C78_01013 [Aureobasidium pullulans]